MASIAELRSNDLQIRNRAWATAYPALWNAASQLLNRILAGTRHTQNREDIAIRAIAELQRILPKLNQIETFADLKGMLLSILRLRVKDFFRSQGLRPEHGIEEESEFDSLVTTPPLSFANEDFETLIARLPPPQPKIFRLHFQDGWTAEEIGQKFNMPRNTVLAHFHRGKITLRKYLEGKKDGPGPTENH